ncbi:MAG: hypothetical protein H6Q85_760, partial [candidate division NC10 bacterium]|nr:hypothetical protein [candidate division NC10 bacterium]
MVRRNTGRASLPVKACSPALAAEAERHVRLPFWVGAASASLPLQPRGDRLTQGYRAAKSGSGPFPGPPHGTPLPAGAELDGADLHAAVRAVDSAGGGAARSGVGRLPFLACSVPRAQLEVPSEQT